MDATEIYNLVEKIETKIDSKFQLLSDGIEALRETINLKLVRKGEIKNLVTRQEMYGALIIMILVVIILVFFADKAGILNLTPIL